MGIAAVLERISPEIPPEVLPKAGNPPKPVQDQETLAQEIRKYFKGSEERIEALTEELNRFIETMRYTLQFIPEKDGRQIVIKVYDSQGKLIRRIPPEGLSAVAEHIGESIGLILNNIFV